MNLEYLKQADQILSPLTARAGGVSVVPLFRCFNLPMILQPGASVTFTKEIESGGAPWELRAISQVVSGDGVPTGGGGVRVQIQLPNGRFLFGRNGVLVTEFCSIGSYRWLQTPALRCEPGSKIQVTLSDPFTALSTPIAVTLLFEGACLYFLGGNPSMKTILHPTQDVAMLASSLPRYQGVLNENILAPPWMSNEGIQTPAGFVDEYYTFASADPLVNPGASTWTVTGSAVTAAPNPPLFEIPIAPGYEFFVRRLLFDIQKTSTATGTVMGKIRTGEGFSLNDANIDLQQYLCGSEYPGVWKVKGGDSVFVDAHLTDPGGTGTITMRVYLEGYRRRLG